MVKYNVIVEGQAETLTHEFDGEPQINLTFTGDDGRAYRVSSRAHDEDASEPTLHAVAI